MDAESDSAHGILYLSGGIRLRAARSFAKER